MKTVLIFIKKWLLFIPTVGSIFLDNLVHMVEMASTREQRTKEKQEIVELVNTLDYSKLESKIALNESVDGNYKEVISVLVQYIHKYSKTE